jgi:DNA-binding transcriptional LysR family regulator
MEIFRAVMLTGTVSGAARMLYVSQPAVSRLLNHTETSLGLKLFERTGGKLLPTPAAVALFEEVQPVYDVALNVDRFVENLANQSTIEISISCSPALGMSLLPRVIEVFHKRNPKTRIRFFTTLTVDVPNEWLSKKSRSGRTRDHIPVTWHCIRKTHPLHARRVWSRDNTDS